VDDAQIVHLDSASYAERNHLDQPALISYANIIGKVTDPSNTGCIKISYARGV
jgi:hypothetical protein